MLAALLIGNTRKQALGPPQKYRYLPVYLHTGTFGVDGIYEPKALHRYRVVTFILVPGGTTNRYL